MMPMERERKARKNVVTVVMKWKRGIREVMPCVGWRGFE